MKREELERLNTEALYSFQAEITGEAPVVIGVDEVGRGPVAGPVTVAAVALPTSAFVLGIKDSKKLSEQKRTRLAREIRGCALGVGLCHVNPNLIDAEGIVPALTLAMNRALRRSGFLGKAPVVIDGNPLDGLPQAQFVVKGDARVAAVAAASIVAKVSRDRVMCHLDALAPAYGFARNKGYGTQEHVAAIKQWGLSAYHRQSFCRNFV